MHDEADVIEEKKKPEIVLPYNKTKGDVGAMDQMAHAFTTKRKTKRWPLVMFFNLLDLASIASSVVFRIKNSVDTLSCKDNRQQLTIYRHWKVTCYCGDKLCHLYRTL
ncbi:Piggybac transposable element-derived protein 4-like protein [Elysia marginata]|uniref:Piggybac transposable element-derived protein 4-like protein n=1 Tax=Elysia marginata TaxID=1093978 RepID=A0AAV4EQS1_9GAST|nr:Piggybac transposable element-derived protein 4-like protein [Elysia marginata]